jgi:hypothetical protein
VADSERRNRGNTLSSVLFAALVVAFAATVLLYLRREEEAVPSPVPPSPEAGHHELVDVKSALEAAGLTVAYGRGTVKAPGLSPPPGQLLTTGETTLFVFIFSDMASRAAASAGLDEAAFRLTTSSGAPVATEGLLLTQGSNVLVAVSGGSSETREQVDRVIQVLP